MLRVLAALSLCPDVWGQILTGKNPFSVRYVSTVDLPESLVPMIAMNMLVRRRIGQMMVFMCKLGLLMWGYSNLTQYGWLILRYPIFQCSLYSFTKLSAYYVMRLNRNERRCLVKMKVPVVVYDRCRHNYGPVMKTFNSPCASPSPRHVLSPSVPWLLSCPSALL